MKTILFLILIICFWTTSLMVLADDDLASSFLNNLNYQKEFNDPGPARTLPRSERKRLRLLKLQNEHKIKKRDINNDEDMLSAQKVTVSRGNIKAIDTINKKSLNDVEGSKNFQFAYNLNDHNREEKLHLTQTSKELTRNINDNNEEKSEIVEAKGSFSFISADGFKYTTKYIADNKGFRPIVLVEKI